MTVDGNSSLETRLRAIEESKEGEYDKRTEHLDDAGKALFINRLIDEDSPYLLQHAHNPVNWFPWGSEAFEVALAENKPVFLSIGYSTCHWCHVMEVESFDSVEVAKVLNKDFVCIKMDREQYPDIDEIYMTAVQIISGHGGWPMSNFLMPDGKPFFAATYFPPENFLQILDQITTAWQDRYGELQKSAHAVQEGVEKILRGRVQDNANPVSQEQLLQALYQREDKERGGLAGAPKFPQEPILLYLLDRAGRTGDWDAEGFISRALQHMGQGGIYDQVAGGFHRYSVDEDWLVPHFEKMLYNQSQLGLVYVQAFVLTANSFFARICRQTMDYVLRDMELPEGGYYSATDADSEGEEGTFFLWTPKQIEDALEPEQAALIADVFGVSTLGNFEGSNILQLDNSLEEWQAQQGDDFLPSLDQALAALYEVRERRIHPVRDDKRIVAWCAAMASTLLQAGLLLQEERWKASACKALDHILASNVDEDGNLSRIYLNGDTSIAAQLEDYANLIQALIVQFDVRGEIDSLDQAYRLMQKAIANYWSAAESCFYLGPREQQGPVLVRSSNAGDGAELSPVATILECLWMLEQRQALLSTSVPNAGNMDDANTPATEMRAIREAAMAALRPAVDGSPLSHTSVMRIQAAFEGGALSPIQYADGGLLRIQGQQTARAGNTRALRIQCEIAASWHLTTPENTGSAFMPLQVELSERTGGWRLVETIYPEQTETLAAEHDALKIYAGSISVALNLSAESERPGAALIKVKYQLCNESSCLLPGELTLLI